MGEDVKFNVLSAESVKTYAEFVGFLALPDALAVSLSEDVTYRLRETLQSASQFMKHAKRRRLTASDFNRALHWSATEPIYGHGSVEEMPFKSTTIKEKEIFFVDDKEVGMRELALGSAIPTDPGDMTVSAQRLCKESSPNSIYADQQNDQVLPNGEANSAGSHNLTDACSSYYDQITEAVLGESERCQMAALNDLETSPKISSLLPYFVHFIASGVKSYSHDLTLLRKLLNMVTALVNNPSFFLEPYVIQLVTSVMYCLLESLAASLNPANNHWSVRDKSARLLAQISRKCNNPVNYLHQQLLMTLQEVLVDDGRPYCSHYGAVVGLMELGPEALEQFLFPHLSTYWTQLQQVLEDVSQSNAQLQDEAYQVYGALLQAAGSLLRSKQKGVPMSTIGFQSNANSHQVLRFNLSPWSGPSLVQRPAPVPSSRSRSSSTCHASDLYQLYQQLYEVFGDSLVPRIAFNNWQDGAVTKSNLLRIQPLTHKYFPVRPLQRDAKSIKELIDKAKEKRGEGNESADDKAKEGQASSTKVSEGQKQTRKTKVAPFTLTSYSKKVFSACRLFDDATFEKNDRAKEKAPSVDKSSRRKSRLGSSSQRETDVTMEIGEEVIFGSRKTLQRARCKVETGKIKRRLRRARPFLANKSKYDYHVGVAL